MSDRRAIVLGLWLLLPACSTSSPLDDAPASEAEPEHATETVDLPVIVLSPSAELLDATTDWAARWSAATGREIVVGEGGHTILAQPDVVNDDGKRLCGGTRLSTGIRVASTQAGTCPGMYETLGHEIGHLIGADGHSESGGVMDVLAPAPRAINAAALELVCVWLECAAFAPES
jgi:hypothetical protein